MPPKLPDPSKIISNLGKAIDTGTRLIDSFSDGIDKISSALGELESPPSAPIVTEETPAPVEKGTACLPCSRDHLSVTSSALGEGVRFARDKGIKDHEVVKRLRIAIDELNIMERIDLAPSETAKLKGKERELANWVLNQSRDLRHGITAIKTPEDMEQVAANAATTTEEFMSRFYEIPEGECETCGEAVQKLRDYIEKRKRERGGEAQ